MLVRKLYQLSNKLVQIKIHSYFGSKRYDGCNLVANSNAEIVSFAVRDLTSKASSSTVQVETVYVMATKNMFEKGLMFK